MPRYANPPTTDATLLTTGILNQARGGLGKAFTHTLTDGYVVYYDAASGTFKMKSESATAAAYRPFIFEDFVTDPTANWTKTDLVGSPTVTIPSEGTRYRIAGTNVQHQKRYKTLALDLNQKYRIQFHTKIVTPQNNSWIIAYLAATSVDTDVGVENDFIRMATNYTSSAYAVFVSKNIAGAPTTLANVASVAEGVLFMDIDATNVTVKKDNNTAILAQTAHSLGFTTAYLYIQLWNTAAGASATLETDWISVLQGV